MAAIKKDKNTLRNQINSHQGFIKERKKEKKLSRNYFLSISPKGLIFVKIAGLV